MRPAIAYGDGYSITPQLRGIYNSHSCNFSFLSRCRVAIKKEKLQTSIGRASREAGIHNTGGNFSDERNQAILIRKQIEARSDGDCHDEWQPVYELADTRMLQELPSAGVKARQSLKR
jgi:hypothetical protein